jgi:glutathione S-transferase
MPTSMTSITLSYAPRSRAGRVRWLLEELGLPYTLRRVTLYSADTTDPAYRALHPLGKVPALVIDDASPMIESGAMLLYLADRFGDRGLAPAVDAPDRPAYLQWIFFGATTLEPPVSDLYFKGTDDATRARGKAEFEAAAAVVSAALADGRAYLLGDRFTAADVQIGSTLGWARALGLLDGFGVLVEYGRRVGARPAARAARAD